jgi:hypothetical protein
MAAGRTGAFDEDENGNRRVKGLPENPSAGSIISRRSSIAVSANRDVCAELLNPKLAYTG